MCPIASIWMPRYTVNGVPDQIYAIICRESVSRWWLTSTIAIAHWTHSKQAFNDAWPPVHHNRMPPLNRLQSLKIRKWQRRQVQRRQHHQRRRPARWTRAVAVQRCKQSNGIHSIWSIRRSWWQRLVRWMQEMDERGKLKIWFLFRMRTKVRWRKVFDWRPHWFFAISSITPQQRKGTFHPATTTDNRPLERSPINFLFYPFFHCRCLRYYEPHLSSIALSNVESSRTIAQVLFEMNETRPY